MLFVNLNTMEQHYRQKNIGGGFFGPPCT